MSAQKAARKSCILLCVLVAVVSSISMGVVEPNDIVTMAYSTSVMVNEASQNCWGEAFRRNSTDNTAYEQAQQLIVELDECQIVAYDVNSIPQYSSTPVYIDLEVDDLFLEWDENDGDHLSKTFTFDGGYVEDSNCEYARVTVTDEDVLKWTLYRVTESGTLRITGTGTNEHDAIHLQRNYLDFTKVADVNECVSPLDTFEYQICYNNDTIFTYDNAFIIDWLPDDVEYPAGQDTYVVDGNDLVFVAGDSNYNEEEHYYVWEIGTISPDDANCVSIEVQVKEYVEPGSILHNVAELWADDGDYLIARDVNDLTICCWDEDPNILYVDEKAKGYNIGTSWINAYTDLADALERATYSKCSENFIIYVAQGTYDPNETEDNSFVLPDGCSVYGGFKTGGCSFEDRNPKKYKTVLTGLIDGNNIPDVDIIVTMGDETLLDGFTVTQSDTYAIYGNEIDCSIENCMITQNLGYGIRVINGDLLVKWCQIKSNEFYGVRHSGDGYNLIIENSQILRNRQYGIHCLQSTPIIKNSVISESDLANEGLQGIRILNPWDNPVLHNNTIANNKAEGISFVDSVNTPKKYPDLQNCIIYYNNKGGGNQLAGLNADEVANFCCIQDCNTLNTNNFNHIPEFAYVIDPNGTPDPNNYHLAADSFCKDLGNPSLTYTSQVDMDDDNRVSGNYVDIGADEVDCEDVHHDLDWNADGIVNMYEFSVLSAAWLSRDPNDPTLPTDPNFIDPNDFIGWNPKCDLHEDYTIDISDLMVLCEDDPETWLWVACWKDIDSTVIESTQMSSMAMNSLFFSADAFSLETTAIEEVESEVSSDTVIQILLFLDDVIADEPDNVADIQDMRAVLMDELKAILSEE